MYHYGQRHLHHQQREYHHRQDDYHRQRLEHHLAMEKYHLREEGVHNHMMASTTTTTTTASTPSTTTTAASLPVADAPVSLPLLSPDAPPVADERHQLSQLGCDTFSCLLSDFELLRTDRGYLLTKEPASEDGAAASCRDNLTCWLGHFDLRPKGYGFELVLKSSENSGAPSAKFPGLQPEHVFQYGEPRLESDDYQDDETRFSAESPEYDDARLFGSDDGAGAEGDRGHEDIGVNAKAAPESDYDNLFGWKR